MVPQCIHGHVPCISHAPAPMQWQRGGSREPPAAAHLSSPAGQACECPLGLPADQLSSDGGFVVGGLPPQRWSQRSESYPMSAPRHGTKPYEERQRLPPRTEAHLRLSPLLRSSTSPLSSFSSLFLEQELSGPPPVYLRVQVGLTPPRPLYPPITAPPPPPRAPLTAAFTYYQIGGMSLSSVSADSKICDRRRAQCRKMLFREES